MKKKIFDVRLYREGLRQLRLLGFLFAVILALIAILVPIGTAIQYSGTLYQVTVGLWDMFPFAVLAYCVFAPIMALVLFKFLTKRNESDFYHAIPQTRTCLMLSFAAAVATWALALQWGGTLLSAIVHASFPNMFIINMVSVLRSSVQVSAAVIFVVAAISLAVSLTGTVLTNIVVSLIIIFVPRGLMFLIRGTISDTLSLVSGDHFLTFFGNGWNVVTGSIFGSFTGGIEDLFLNFRAGAYTFIVAIIYIVLACVAFNKRRSEAAGNAAINGVLRLIIRLIPATLFCLIPDFLIFYDVAEQNTIDAGTAFQYFELYLVGVVIYFLYELITTRKWRNMIKAVPGLVILAALNVVIVLGMVGARNNVLAFSPSADKIDYVSMLGSTSSNEDDYLLSGISKIKITDEEIVDTVAKRLAEEVECEKSEVSWRYYEEGTSYRDVLICANGVKKYRTVRFASSDLEEIAQFYESDESVKNLYMNLPEANEPGVTVSCGELTEFDTQKMYEALLSDVEDMGFEDWYLCANGELEYNAYYTYLTLTVSEGGKEKYTTFDITELTPKAASVYLAAMWDEQETARDYMLNDLNGLYDALSDGETLYDISYDCSLWANLADGEQKYISLDLSDAEQVKYLIDFVEEAKNLPIESSEKYVSVSAYAYYEVPDDDDWSVSASITYMGDEVWSSSTAMDFGYDCYFGLPDDLDVSGWEGDSWGIDNGETAQDVGY